MKALTINHAAVWVCIVLAHALGFLWYGALFSETWMELSGLTEADVQNNPPGAGHWIANFIAIVTPIYLLAWLYTKMGVKSGIQGAIIAFLITFCFTQTTLITNGLFAMKPYELAWVNGGSGLLTMTVVGFILGAWKKYKG